MMELNKFIHEIITIDYKNIIKEEFSDYLSVWPLINGFKETTYYFKEWIIIVINNNSPHMFHYSGTHALPQAIIGFDNITNSNINIVRENIKRFAHVEMDGGVLIFKNNGEQINRDSELAFLLKQHKYFLGLSPMKIFLSHKSEDKVKLVRDYKQTLQLLGFDPWIDEDAMVAGANLERGILQGFKESCAVVFFITENFSDERFLATEIDYALRRKREDENFAIITIVFTEDAQIPDILMPYVWKKVSTQLEGLREIIKALPLALGQVYVK